MIGARSGKVIGYATRTKRCAVCEASQRLNKLPRDHDCRVNWSGSAKAMEPDVGAELVKSCGNKHQAKIGILIGDDDSATIKKVRESVTHEVEKWSDVVHAKRTFTSHLYCYQKKFKGVLTNKVIQYFTKSFSYALQQNKNNEAGLKTSLQSIVPHAFGNHSLCNVSWCGYLTSPSTYKHKSLPYGKDLDNPDLREALESIIEIFVANVKKLSPLGSSQSNEAINNTIGSKAPKIRYYGSSESNDYRVACAVSQKNIGYTYVAKVS